MHLLASVFNPNETNGGAVFSAGGTPIQLPKQINTVTQLSGTFGINVIKLGINVLIFAAVLLAFLFIIYGGFKWMTSQGDKKAVEGARNTIIYSVVGLLVVALSYLVISVLGKFLGIQIIGK